MKRLRFLLPVLSFALCPPAHTATVRIQSCWDGDTCTASTGERIRLACVDAEEVGEPGADRATRAIRSMVVGKTVGIRRIAKDRYSRSVAELYTDGTNVGQQLVAQGYARIYRRYAFQCPWAR